MGKQTKKKKSTGAAKEIFAKAPGRLGKWNVIAFAVLVVGELIYYYAATSAINIQSGKFLGMDGDHSWIDRILYT